MKTTFRAIIVLAAFAVISVLPAGSLAQEPEGYSFFSGTNGTMVCIGQYRPPSSDNATGFCQGQMLGLDQFSAVAARQSADRLDRIGAVLEAIDEKLAANNQQLQLLTGVTANAQTAAVRREIELLNEAISQRFESVPEEVMANIRFREELDRLKQDIMVEVEKRLSVAAKK